MFFSSFVVPLFLKVITFNISDSKWDVYTHTLQVGAVKVCVSGAVHIAININAQIYLLVLDTHIYLYSL